LDWTKLRKLSRFPRIAWHYKRGNTRLPYGPIRLWVEPTAFCNLKCPMCTSPMIPEEKIGYMDMGLYRKIIDQAKGFVYDMNLFLGGESLFHKELPEMIRYAGANGIGTRLSTNATILTKEKTAALLDAGLDFILFSFDGYEKEVYEQIRVNANFEKTLGYIVDFLEEKQRRGSRKPYVVFQVIEFTDLTGRGKEQERDAFLKRLKGLPIDKFSFIQPHTFGGKIEREAEKGFRTMTPKYVSCTFLWYSMTIRWDGTVVPCCVDLSGDMPLADLKKDSLLDVWNGPVLRDMRKKIAAKRYLEVPLCSGCDILWKEQVFGVPVKSFKELRYFLPGMR
jgi:MoaA/NifB/PqqE/SkfB family radical SAM enzyme